MSGEKYWTYQSSFPTPSFEELPEGCFGGTEAQWFQLSPGMRREIVRSFKKHQTERVDPRDPDYSRPGIFAHHNCSRCKDGTDLSRCPTPDRPGNCGYPHSRND